jgi:hypothetical protein
MNRPFGAGEFILCQRSSLHNTFFSVVDISANIKGVVSKPAVQKILMAAAEKGEVSQKTYGEPNQTRSSLSLGCRQSNQNVTIFRESCLIRC